MKYKHSKAKREKNLKPLRLSLTKKLKLNLKNSKKKTLKRKNNNFNNQIMVKSRNELNIES